MGAVLAMAKGTVSVEPAGEAEKATAVKLEASEPRAYGEAGSRCEGCYKARPAMMLRHHHECGLCGWDNLDSWTCVQLETR